MKIQMYALFLLLSPAVFGTEAQPPQPADMPQRAQVLEAAQAIESICLDGIPAMLDQSEKSHGVPASVMGKVISPEYCSCISDQIKRNVAPNLLQRSKEAEFEKALGVYARDCIVQKFKSTIPQICKAWMGEFMPNKEPDQALQEKLETGCNCMQRVFNTVESEIFESAMDASMQDYRDYKEAPDKFTTPRPGSIFPAWHACIQNGNQEPIDE